MSIINKQPAIVKREYAIEEPVALVVERYAAFIQSTPDYRGHEKHANYARYTVIKAQAEFGRSHEKSPLVDICERSGEAGLEIKRDL
jgi:hypothetical protein